MGETEAYWTVCLECKGQGQKSRRVSKKTNLRYHLASEEFKRTKSDGLAPIRPKGQVYSCANCSGSGLVPSSVPPVADTEKYPQVAIIGGGIGGVALAVACLHRGIPFTLYERDNCFDARSQGYGLTLQQASKAIEGLGLFTLDAGVISSLHVVHTTDGNVIGEWGMRKRSPLEGNPAPKRRNIHIARQSLRLGLLEQLGGDEKVQWNHQLVDFKTNKETGVELSFEVNGELKHAKADLVVGADGIRSTVRKLLIGEALTPLRYLGCIVILGICPLKNLEGFDHSLLDSETVFQTANSEERMYMMPYDAESVMWQLSFPLTEKEAKALSDQGPEALKEEACRRTQWHDPVPQILAATHATQVSGYPVYDRVLLQPEVLAQENQVTLIGDAAHPMSPFKGQGANQALLDALSLAREISKGCGPLSGWRELGLRKNVLTSFESEMLARSASKVTASAEASKFLHSETVLCEGNETRGRKPKNP